MNKPWFWPYLSSKNTAERRAAHWLARLSAHTGEQLPLRWTELPILAAVDVMRDEYEWQYHWYQLLLEGVYTLSAAECERVSVPEQPFDEVEITETLAQIRAVVEHRGLWGRFRAWCIRLVSSPPRLTKTLGLFEQLEARLEVIELSNLPTAYHIHELLSDPKELNVVLIEAQEFQMGDKRYPESQPVHTVELSEDIVVSGHLISRSLFKVIMCPDDNFETENIQSNIKLDTPAVSVSWIEAIEFCNRLSRICDFTPAYHIDDEGVDWNPIADGWRLPTEAEWELCARGNGKPQNRKNQWTRSNKLSALPSLGQHSPNGLQLYDMLGLVWEWCWDAYEADYYAKSPQINPNGPDQFSFRYAETAWHSRVKRGGSYLSPARKINAFRRSKSAYDWQENYMGFRICRRIKKAQKR